MVGYANLAWGVHTSIVADDDDAILNVTMNAMTKQQLNDFEETLTALQCVLIARRAQASDEKVRLNWNHFTILELLYPKKVLEPSAISEQLNFSRPNTSKYLKYLEVGKLIKRSPHEHDARSHRVALTSSGYGIIDAIISAQHKNARLVCGTLSPEEQQQFTRITQKIIAALDGDELRTV